MIDATYRDRGNDVDISGESIPDDRDSLRRWAPTRTCLSGRWLPGRAAKAIPSRLSRGAMSRFGEVAKRASHRLEPGTGPVREIFDDKWYARVYGLAGDRRSLLLDYVQDGARPGGTPTPSSTATGTPRAIPTSRAWTDLRKRS